MRPDFDSTVAHNFFRAFERYPSHTALAFSDRSYTYEELMRLVQAIWRKLDLSVSSTERRIAVYATADVHTYASILAIVASGRTYVPLNPHSPPDRNWSCIEQAETSTLLHSGADAKAAQWPKQVNAIDTRHTEPSPEFRRPSAISDSDVVYLLFTSGSTGKPKGVPIYHRNLKAFMRAFFTSDGFDFKDSDRFLQMFDLTFDLSVMCFFAPLSIGAACHVVSDDGVGFVSVAETLQRGRVTVALMAPSVLTFLERFFDEISLPELRYSLFCGEALPAALAAKWRHCIPNAKLYNVYGPTEATIFCTIYEIPHTEVEMYNGIVSIGKAMPGTSLLVIDPDGKPLEHGEKGELCLAGGQITDQYWRDAQKTGQSFIRVGNVPAYRTGDIVYKSGENYFYCGRADHQVKIDGFRVELGEIEHHARSFSGVTAAAAVAKQTANGSYAIHLFVEGSPEVGTMLPALKTHLASKLPPYMMPRKVHPLASLPLNQNGKIDRKKLLATLDEG